MRPLTRQGPALGTPDTLSTTPSNHNDTPAGRLTDAGLTRVLNRAEWRVVYRRANGAHQQVRVFQRRHAMAKFVGKVTASGRPNLAEIVELRVERRVVGDWCEIGPIVDLPTGNVIGGTS